eukprot:scaffold874_cov233-Pinguiococcus_pyrenoidosus.AAC.11
MTSAPNETDTDIRSTDAEVFHLMQSFVEALRDHRHAHDDQVVASAYQLAEHFQSRASPNADSFVKANSALFELMKADANEVGLLKRWNAAMEHALGERVGSERHIPSSTPILATLLCQLWAMDGARAYALYSESLLHKLSEVLRDAALSKFQSSSEADAEHSCFVRGKEHARSWVDFLKGLRQLIGDRRIPIAGAAEHPMPSLLRATTACLHLLSEATPTKNTSKLPGFSPDHIFHLQKAAEGIVLALETRMQEQYGKSGSLHFIDATLRALIPLVVEAPALTAKSRDSWGADGRRSSAGLPGNGLLEEESIKRDAPFLSFLQHAALYASERGEHRALVVRLVCGLLAKEQEIVRGLEERRPCLTKAFCGFLRRKLVRSKAQKHRVIVVELVAALLDTLHLHAADAVGTDQVVGDEAPGTMSACGVDHSDLFRVLLSRMADKSQTVRARALSGIATSLKAKVDADAGRVSLDAEM